MKSFQKRFEQDTDTSEMDEGGVMVDVAFITHHDPPGILQPGVQPFDLPAAAFAPQRAAILCLGFGAIAPMRGNQGDALGLQLGIERITVKAFVPDQPFGSNTCETARKRWRNKGDFIRRSTRHVNGERKASAVCHCHDFAAFAALALADARAPLLAGANVPSMKHSDKFRRPRCARSSARALTIRSKIPASHQA